MSERKTDPGIAAVEKGETVEDKARLVSALLSIAKSTRALFGLKLKELGFYNGQDELLLALDERAAVSVSVLAEKLNVRPSTVSKMMDRLVEQGMLERMPDRRDARRTLVRITAIGVKARSSLLSLREGLEAELITSVPGDSSTVIEALEVVAGGLNLRLKRLR